jgi:hypothetical protein
MLLSITIFWPVHFMYVFVSQDATSSLLNQIVQLSLQHIWVYVLRFLNRHIFGFEGYKPIMDQWDLMFPYRLKPNEMLGSAGCWRLTDVLWSLVPPSVQPTIPIDLYCYVLNIEAIGLSGKAGNSFTLHALTFDKTWFQTFALFWMLLCFLLGKSPAPEFYMPRFRNTLSVPS